MTTVLMLVAFLLFVLSALNTSISRVNLQSAGLACWVLALLLPLLGVLR
jgi:hypothetical protein